MTLFLIVFVCSMAIYSALETRGKAWGWPWIASAVYSLAWLCAGLCIIAGWPIPALASAAVGVVGGFASIVCRHQREL